MKNLIEKIKEIETKVWIGIGIGCAVVVLAGVLVLLGGKSKPDAEKDGSHFAPKTESEECSEVYQTEEDTSLDTQGSETEMVDTQETEVSSEEISESQKEDETASATKPTVPTTPSQSEVTPPVSQDPSEEMPQMPDESQVPSEPETPAVLEEYTVNITSAGGHKLYNVKVHAYTDAAMTNLFTTAATNSKGTATLKLEVGKDYVIALSNVPVGYHLSDSYLLSGKTTSIVLESSVVTGQAFPSKKLKAGNVMYDFTVPSADGGTITLSEIIKTKEMVILNFWYVNCHFCVMEFPYMSSAYNRYSDRVEIIALDPFDTMDTVQNFLVETPLPFKVATCDTSIPNLFGIDSYPVSVVIDKYGVIREIEKGAILEESGFINLFEKYL